MSNKPTKTRAQLRQALEIERGNEFHRRFSTNPTFTGGSATTPSDSDNALSSDFWKNGWLYVATTSTGGAPQDEARKITAYSEGVFTLEYALSTAVDTAATYEILDVFSPAEVHTAINRAIDEAFPSFYDVINDETLVVEYDQMAYDLTGLSSRPWMITNVYVERNDTVQDGVTGSATDSTLTDTTADFSDVESGWLISIYRGTGSGQLRTVSSATTTAVTTTANWTTNPDSTSYYKVWNPNEQSWDWRRLMAVRFDQKQYPSYMYLTDNLNYSGVVGLRFRIQYCTYPAELSADSDETVVPQEWVVNKALAKLFGSRAAWTTRDRRTMQELEAAYDAKAETYRQRHAFRMPAITLWMEKDGKVRNYADDNPLDWR